MSERKERCETCRFWEEVVQKLGRAGDCRRYPPALPLTAGQPCGDDDALGMFPVVGFKAWCGEWQAMPLPVIPPD